MLKTSLVFVGIALIAILLADLEVSTQYPWLEMSRMVSGAFTPDLPVVWEFKSSLFNTVVFALCGTFLGGILGIGLAAFFQYMPVRLFCAFGARFHNPREGLLNFGF